MKYIDLDSEIKEIQLKIENATKIISEHKIILRYLESKRDNKEYPNEPVKTIEPVNIDIEKLIDNQNRRRFADYVSETIDYFDSREFNVPMIAAAMARLKIIYDEDNKVVRSRISAALLNLTKDGKLARTFTGIGNIPHKYKTVNRIKAEEISH